MPRPRPLVKWWERCRWSLDDASPRRLDRARLASAQPFFDSSHVVAGGHDRKPEALSLFDFGASKPRSLPPRGAHSQVEVVYAGGNDLPQRGTMNEHHAPQNLRGINLSVHWEERGPQLPRSTQNRTNDVFSHVSLQNQIFFFTHHDGRGPRSAADSAPPRRGRRP